MSAKTIRITQVRSNIGQRPAVKKTLQALGLGRIGRAKELSATPSVEGMARVVSHLVRVDELRK